MIIVTGGAGFIGSNIVARLASRGNRDIVVCDRLRSENKWRNIAKAELADVIHPEDLFDFLDKNQRRISAIIHMGAISATTEKDADKILDNNFRLSMDLWDWCTEKAVRLIYASSAATYGDGDHGFVDNFSVDHLAKLRPLNPYGWSKHLFDRRISRIVTRAQAVPEEWRGSTESFKPPQWVGLKFFNVYGQNEYHKGRMMSVVNHAFQKAVQDEPVTLFRSHRPDYTDGGQTRDFIYVDDCVDVIEWMLENPSVSGVFNCGTGQGRTFLDLAKAVYAAMGKDENIQFVDTPEDIRDKYQYFTEADMRNLRAVGYDKPFTSLEEGVRRYVQDYLMQDDPYK